MVPWRSLHVDSPPGAVREATQVLRAPRYPPPAVYQHEVTAKAPARGRHLFQAYALGVAASVAFGFALQSCGFMASGDCTEKADCTADGPDGMSPPTGNPDASPVE